MFRIAFLAYGVVTMDEEILFIDSVQLDDTARQNLDYVNPKPYYAIFKYLNSQSRILELGRVSNRSSSSSPQLQLHYRRLFSRKSR